MLGGICFPSDGKLDVTSDLPMAIAGCAIHFTLGPALGAVLLAMPMFRVLAVEAPKVSKSLLNIHKLRVQFSVLGILGRRNQPKK